MERVWLKTGGLFGYTSVRGMLSCVSSDLPATRKICGFASHSATMGCSKCYKSFHQAHLEILSDTIV